MAFDPIALALETPTPEGFEDRVIEQLDRAVGFDVAYFATKAGPPRTRGIDEGALARALATGAYDDEIGPIKSAALARRGVVVDTELLGEVRVKATRYHRDFAAPIGGRHSLMAYLVVRGVMLGGIMLGRCGGRFSEAHVRLVEDALPGLTIARASYAGVPAASIRAALPARRRGTILDLLRGETLRESSETAQGTLSVRDRGGHREMIASNAGRDMIWSRVGLGDPTRSGWPYVDLFHVVAALARERRSALFIGCGGAVALRQFAASFPGIGLDLVEIDAEVVRLARVWFGLDAIPNLRVHEEDGASFVARHRARWSMAIVDAYGAGDLAEGFDGALFFQRLRDALVPGGAAAVNVVGALAGPGPARAALRAMRKAFEDIRVLPVIEPGEPADPHALRNIVLVGARRD